MTAGKLADSPSGRLPRCPVVALLAVRTLVPAGTRRPVREVKTNPAEWMVCGEDLSGRKPHSGGSFFAALQREKRDH